jgi:hypothetical protein
MRRPRRVQPQIRPGTAQPQGGNGVVLRDGEGATAAEIAAGKVGPNAGNRNGQPGYDKPLLMRSRADRLTKVHSRISNAVV